ncbi:arsenate reductase [Raoultella planticola]|uniref:Arsenate reductase n=1 Tax=Raoultella planticola TaxID=575 RepID=A0A485C1M2_RAOPL|nr:arsenate reductase [Raoultella planticola]
MSDAVKIYHNPRCSKSRDTLSLLKANGIDPEVVLYLGDAAGCRHAAPAVENARHGQRPRTDAPERGSV